MPCLGVRGLGLGFWVCALSHLRTHAHNTGTGPAHLHPHVPNSPCLTDFGAQVPCLAGSLPASSQERQAHLRRQEDRPFTWCVESNLPLLPVSLPVENFLPRLPVSLLFLAFSQDCLLAFACMLSLHPNSLPDSPLFAFWNAMLPALSIRTLLYFCTGVANVT